MTAAQQAKKNVVAQKIKKQKAKKAAAVKEVSKKIYKKAVKKIDVRAKALEDQKRKAMVFMDKNKKQKSRKSQKRKKSNKKVMDWPIIRFPKQVVKNWLTKSPRQMSEN